MPPRSFTELPLSVVLQICRSLDARTVVALSSTCRALHSATNERALWDAEDSPLAGYPLGDHHSRTLARAPHIADTARRRQGPVPGKPLLLRGAAGAAVEISSLMLALTSWYVGGWRVRQHCLPADTST